MASKQVKILNQNDDIENHRLLIEENVCLKTRTISIVGEIKPEDFAKFDAAMTLLEREASGDITVRIASEGGDYYESTAIMGRIEYSTCNDRHSTNKIDIEQTEKEQIRYCNFMASVTNKNAKYWNKLASSGKDIYFTPEDAIKIGLISEII